MTFVDIGDEDFIVAESVVRVKKIDDGKCSLWLTGQSALEGFVVERNSRELVEEICAACAEDDEEVEDEDE
jgi:hypothetical protein